MRRPLRSVSTNGAPGRRAANARRSTAASWSNASSSPRRPREPSQRQTAASNSRPRSKLVASVLHQLHLHAGGRGGRPRLAQHAAGDVDAGDRQAGARQLHGVPARPAADARAARLRARAQHVEQERRLAHAVGGEHLVHVLRRVAVEELAPDVVGHGPSVGGRSPFFQESAPRASGRRRLRRSRPQADRPR